MKYSIIVVAYSAFDLLERCLKSIAISRLTDYEVVMVDNSPKAWKENIHLPNDYHPDFAYQYHHDSINHGFAEGCNIGARMAKGEILIFLNPDTEVYGDWADQMAKYLDQPKVGAVGPISNFVAGLQRVDYHMQMGDTPEETAEIAAVALKNRGVDTKLLIGFCLMMKKAVYEELGGMDPVLFLGNDDLDLSWRLRLAGYDLVIASDVFVYHAGHKSFETRPKPEVEKLLQESEDALRAKLIKHYDGNPPSAVELWGVDFFYTGPVRPMTLSVCMIVRDEQENLKVLLPQLRSLGCEVVIVDTKPDRRYGFDPSFIEEWADNIAPGLIGDVHAYLFPWVDDFAAARNFALSKCTGDYILWLDADDRVTPENAALIRAALQNPGPKTLNKHAVYAFTVENLTAEGKVKQRFHQPRMFPNGRGIQWTGRIHESIIPHCNAQGLHEEPVSITIQHTGYSDPVIMAKKCERNLRILTMEPDSPAKFYNIGNTLGMVRQFQAALDAYDEALTREWAEPLMPAFRDQVRHMASLQLLNLGDIEGMAKYLDDSRHPDAPYMAARVHEARGNLRAAVELLRGYLEDTRKPTFYWPWGSDYPATRPAAYALLIQLTAKLHDATLDEFAKEYPEHCIFQDAAE